MAYEIPILIASFKAGADLSAASNKYRFVKFDANGDVILVAAITDVPAGVLQNTPGLAGTAEVMVLGFSKVNADAAFAEGIKLAPSADGQAQTAVGTQHVVGQSVEEATAAGQLVTAMINCMSPTIF